MQFAFRIAPVLPSVADWIVFPFYSSQFKNVGKNFEFRHRGSRRHPRHASAADGLLRSEDDRDRFRMEEERQR